MGSVFTVLVVAKDLLGGREGEMEGERKGGRDGYLTPGGEDNISNHDSCVKRSFTLHTQSGRREREMNYGAVFTFSFLPVRDPGSWSMELPTFRFCFPTPYLTSLEIHL